MDIDWQRLIEVRRRHRTVAQDGVARERETVGRHEAQRDEAHAALQRRVDEQARMWSATTGAGSGLSISGLRDAAAWSRSLDAGIAEATRAARDTEDQLAARQRDLEAARARLRAAASELRRAEEMDQRARADRRRTVENRADEVADEAATQAWTRAT